MSLPLLGWLTGAVFFFYAWVLRVAPSVMVEELMREFSVGATAVGSLSAFYFYGYAGMQIPVGILIDRFGPRRLLALAALVCSGACVLAAWSPTIEGMYLGRFMIGASAAFSLVGAMSVAAQWFQPTRFARLSGLAMRAGMSGGVLGQAPVRLLIEHNGWRPTLAYMASGGLLIALMAVLFVRDRRRGQGGLATVFRGLALVVRNPQSWIVALAGLGANGTLLGFAGLWGVPFMRVAHGLEPTQAAFITSLMIAGWGAGAPAFGWLSDRIGYRRIPFLIGYAISLPCMFTLVFATQLPLLAVTSLTFLAGFGGAAQIVCFASIRELNPPEFSATALGFVNAVITATGALYQPLIGYILDLVWSGGLHQGARVYAIGDFRTGFLPLMIGMIIGLLCTAVMRETRCRQIG
ncbi:MAG: MFS transporter [Hyphomicrobiaceae bacterium]